MLRLPRALNLVHVFAAERTREEDRARLDAEWTGPLTTRGAAPREPGAPYWWHGDEDASASSMAAAAALARGRK